MGLANAERVLGGQPVGRRYRCSVENIKKVIFQALDKFEGYPELW